MSDYSTDDGRGEALARISRLLVHPLWVGATVEEIARDADAPPALVRRLRAELERSTALGEVLDYARHVRAATGWEGSTLSLITVALAGYLADHQRDDERQAA